MDLPLHVVAVGHAANCSRSALSAAARQVEVHAQEEASRLFVAELLRNPGCCNPVRTTSADAEHDAGAVGAGQGRDVSLCHGREAIWGRVWYGPRAPQAARRAQGLLRQWPNWTSAGDSMPYRLIGQRHISAGPAIKRNRRVRAGRRSSGGCRVAGRQRAVRPGPRPVAAHGGVKAISGAGQRCSLRWLSLGYQGPEFGTIRPVQRRKLPQPRHAGAGQIRRRDLAPASGEIAAYLLGIPGGMLSCGHATDAARQAG